MEENIETQRVTTSSHHRAVIVITLIIFLGGVGYGIWGYAPILLTYIKGNQASIASGGYISDPAQTRGRVETYSSRHGTIVTEGTISVLSGSAQVVHGVLTSMSFELDMNTLDVYSHDATKNALAGDFLKSSSVFNTVEHPRITLLATSQEKVSLPVVFNEDVVLDAEVYIVGVPYRVKIPVLVTEIEEGKLSLKTRITLPSVLGEFSLKPFFLGIDQGISDTFDIVVEMMVTKDASS